MRRDKGIGGDWGQQEDKVSIAALHTAIDQGINFIDTAAGYGNGRSEKIIAEILKPLSHDLLERLHKHYWLRADWYAGK